MMLLKHMDGTLTCNLRGEHSYYVFYWSAARGTWGQNAEWWRAAWWWRQADSLETTFCLWGKWFSRETASLSTSSIDLLLMMLDQLNMHDIEWLCLRARQFHICMLCLSLVLLSRQQWIFTCLLTHLIGFAVCGQIHMPRLSYCCTRNRICIKCVI